MKSAFKIATVWVILAILFHSFTNAQNPHSKEAVREQITATGNAVREAFKKGDVETIKLYHHPDVVKALGYNNLRIGRKAVLDGLRETMSNFEMEFLGEKQEEVFIIKDDLVIEQLLFALRLIPKNGNEPFVFRGRTLIILQRYEDSPTGWVTLHEIIQPFEE